ncbi:MAG: hypothetical protein ACYCT6_09960 [bacterium]|jgi:hypothetical protein
MDNVTLEWEKVEDSIKKLDDTEFYAFTQNNTLLYIGIAYFQDVADEIRKTIKAFNYNEDEIKIWLGYIVESDYERITEEIIRDVECLLICGNKPLDNTQCKDNYTGRDNLIIKNNGCRNINDVKCKNLEIFIIK